MTKTELSALLGRPLSSVEDTNFELYEQLAEQALKDLTCTSFTNVEESRTFDLREGYSTAFVDIFRSVSNVQINGNDVDSSEYETRQWDKRTADWYNSLVFDDLFTSRQETITVTAQWGFETRPKDLELLKAGLFDLISKRNQSNPMIHSKRVEDFQVTFNDIDADSAFYSKYRPFIAKYSLCNIPNIQHGGC